MSKNIFFCADGNYIKFVPSVIESIMVNSKVDYIFNIISDVPKPKRFLCSVMEDGRGINLKWHKIGTSTFEGLKEVSHFTKAMYYRLLIPSLVKDSEVALYLDCDILVRSCISELFEIDLLDNYVAAVRNPLFERHESLKLRESDGYFNSGVLLINVRKWNSEGFKDKIIDIISNKKDVLLMPDQDALNIASNGKWLSISDTYNMQVSTLSDYDSFNDNSKEFLESLRSPKIVHFSATNKQWHHSCFLKYRKEYLKLNSSITIIKRNYVVDKIISFAFKVYYKVFRLNKYI